MPDPAPLFDISDSKWQFGLDGAVRMANAASDTPLLLHHWASADAPDFDHIINKVIPPQMIYTYMSKNMIPNENKRIKNEDLFEWTEKYFNKNFKKSLSDLALLVDLDQE